MIHSNLLLILLICIVYIELRNQCWTINVTNNFYFQIKKSLGCVWCYNRLIIFRFKIIDRLNILQHRHLLSQILKLQNTEMTDNTNDNNRHKDHANRCIAPVYPQLYLHQGKKTQMFQKISKELLYNRNRIKEFI